MEESEPHMKVAIVGDLIAFPSGFASTSRCISVCNGILKQGGQVHVASLNDTDGLPTSVFGNKVPGPGVFRGIQYSYPRQSQLVRALESPSVYDLVVGKTLPRYARQRADRRWMHRVGIALEADLRSFASRDGLDAVIVESQSSDFCQLIAMVARRNGALVVLQSTESPTAHIADEARRSAYIRTIVDEFDGIDCVSQYLRDFWVSRGFALDRTTVGPNPVDTDFFVARAAVVEHRLVYVGQIAHREAWDLVDIMQVVTTRVPDAHLLIVGPGTEEKVADLRDHIEQSGLSSAITLTGPVTRAELPGIMSSAEALLLPRTPGEYSSAGLPNKLSEYLSVGRPAVMTSVGEIGTYVVDGETARLVAPSNLGVFAAACVELLEDCELANRIGAAGRELAVRLLSEDAYGERITQFIRGLRSRGRSD